jgi:hypothetical protein
MREAETTHARAKNGGACMITISHWPHWRLGWHASDLVWIKPIILRLETTAQLVIGNHKFTISNLFLRHTCVKVGAFVAGKGCLGRRVLLLEVAQVLLILFLVKPWQSRKIMPRPLWISVRQWTIQRFRLKFGRSCTVSNRHCRFWSKNTQSKHTGLIDWNTCSLNEIKNERRSRKIDRGWKSTMDLRTALFLTADDEISEKQACWETKWWIIYSVRCSRRSIFHGMSNVSGERNRAFWNP